MEQKVEGFKRTEAPITALILMEYSARGMGFRIQALNAALAFAEQLRPQDYIAMMTFDLNTHIVSDFTQDKTATRGGHGDAGERSLHARGVFTRPTSSTR